MTKICRKAYHGNVTLLESWFCVANYFVILGVPKIIKGSLPDYMAHCDDPKWPLYAKYMSTTRINLNIRQVFPNEP
jgi:alkylated DNA repair protein alkB family protein 1